LGAALVMAVAGALAACGSATLDRQQQEATSRECISLLDRRATRGNITVEFRLDGDTFDLGRDPTAFYDALRRLRGPDAFPLDASNESDTGRQDVVRRKCSGSDPPTTTTSTTTTTTSTAVPATTSHG
jgi:hypothetical protein